jgi:hypothetical protein
MHVTLISVGDAPTERWPASLTEELNSSDAEEILVTYIDYPAPLVAGGSGAVTILPDLALEPGQHAQSYTFPPTYQQAAVTSWMATKQAIEQDIYGWSVNNGNGCTMMDSVVSVAGVSEGGNAVISAAPALQEAGVYSISAGATSLIRASRSLSFFIGVSTFTCVYMTVCRCYLWIQTSLFLFLFLFLSLLLYD